MSLYIFLTPEDMHHQEYKLWTIVSNSAAKWAHRQHKRTTVAGRADGWGDCTCVEGGRMWALCKFPDNIAVNLKLL